jgi:hypothetical protein
VMCIHTAISEVVRPALEGWHRFCACFGASSNDNVRPSSLVQRLALLDRDHIIDPALVEVLRLAIAHRGVREGTRRSRESGGMLAWVIAIFLWYRPRCKIIARQDNLLPLRGRTTLRWVSTGWSWRGVVERAQCVTVEARSKREQSAVDGSVYSLRHTRITRACSPTTARPYQSLVSGHLVWPSICSVRVCLEQSVVPEYPPCVWARSG